MIHIGLIQLFWQLQLFVLYYNLICSQISSVLVNDNLVINAVIDLLFIHHVI